jgi:predicted nucleotidyltransferase
MSFQLKAIFAALADAGTQYVVVGGLAVILHGHLRATRDLDLIIGLDRANCERAIAALAGTGLRPRLPVQFDDFADETIRESLHTDRNMLVFQLWDPQNELRSVDIFVREPIAIAELLSEAIVKYVEGVPIRIASIRHLIQLKRAAGRRHDLDDIAALREIARQTNTAVE